MDYEILHFWEDHENPDMPPRSRLFCPEPMYMGTAMSEGLVSYIVRLGASHSVSPRLLVRKIFPEAGAELRQSHYAPFFSRHAGTVNGLGKYAEAFSSAVAALNGLDSARQLTLLALKNVLPANGAGLTGRHPKWCPTCLAEMKSRGEESYHPLAWSLAAVNTCPVHKRSLQNACSHCGRRQPFFPNYPDLGLCAHCKSPLWDGSMIAHDPAPADLWLANAAGDLIKHLADIENVDTLGNFIAFLNTMIQAHADGNRAAFCRKIGLPKWALTGWMTHGRRPSLPQMLSVCHGLGMMPSRIFLGAEDGRAVAVPANQSSKFFVRKERPNLDAEERRKINAELSRILSKQVSPIPLAEVARSFGLTRSCLSYWFPKECAEVTKLHSSFQRKLRRRRYREQHDYVDRVVIKLIKEGLYPGRKQVDTILRTQGISLMRKDLFDAYQRSLQQHLEAREPSRSESNEWEA